MAENKEIPRSTLDELHEELARYPRGSETNRQILEQIHSIWARQAAIFKVFPNSERYWVPADLRRSR